MVGPGRLELPTLRLSGVRSNHLSYGAMAARRPNADPMAERHGCAPYWARDRTAWPERPTVIGKRNEDGDIPPAFLVSLDVPIDREDLEGHP